MYPISMQIVLIFIIITAVAFLGVLALFYGRLQRRATALENDHLRLEEELRACQEHYQNLIQYSAEGIWRLDFDEPIPLDLPPLEQVRRIHNQGYLAECNDALARMYGYSSRADLIGKRLLELYGGAPTETNIQSTLKLVESGYIASDRETEEVNSQGEKVYFLNTAAGILRGGYLMSIWGAQRDITHLKRIEAEQRQAAARVQAMLDSLPDTIFETTREGLVINFSPGEGIPPASTPQEMLYRNLAELLPPRFSQLVLSALQRAFQTGKEQIIEYRLPAELAQTNPAINPLPLHASELTQMRDYEARILVTSENTALCMLRDVTQRRESEKQIRLYADIVRNMQIGMYIIQAEDLNDDTSLRVIGANPTALRYSDKTAEQVLGKKIDQAFRTLRSKGFPQQYLKCLKTRQPVELEDIYYDTQYNMTEAFAVKVFPLSSDTVGVLFEDVTQRKLAEDNLRRFNIELEQRVAERTAQLKAANDELSSFSYSVSHDLRAPLRGIDGYSRLLLEDYSQQLDEIGRDYLGRMRSAARQMNDMIDALLSLSRLTRAPLQIENVDLSQIARQIIQNLQESEPGRRVEVSIAPGLIAACDPRLAHIALQNLLDNAWKYSAGQDPARIEFGITDLSINLLDSAERSRQAFYVSDNGAGFDMQQAAKLFNPFQRLHRADEFPGVGIGLTTVQRIIHRHGGRIWATSVVNQGTTFYFTLP